MEDPTQLRVPEDANFPCRLCNRRYLRAEAHWFCSFCRRSDVRAQCQENCIACVAMVEEEWRRKALMINEQKRYYNHTGKRPRSTPSSYMKKRSRSVNLPRKKKNKPEEKFADTPYKPADPVCKPITAYSMRLKEFESFIYGDLNPVIPESLVENGFTLPKVSSNLNARFDITKSELMRLLASSSICYHLSNNRSQFCDENNQIFNASSDGIVALFASLIKFKANALGKVIFDIRKELLANVTSENTQIISQMIYGPINPKESFFGNIDLLKEAVETDKNNVLRRWKIPTQSIVKNEESSSDDFEYEVEEPSYESTSVYSE